MAPPVPSPQPPPVGTDPLLVFRLERRLYGIELRHVAGVEPERQVRPVPGAPEAVLGLVESRGRLLTVIDLPRLLGDGPHSLPPCLVRLGPPWSDVAFHVPAVVQIGRLREGAARPEMPGMPSVAPSDVVAGQPHVLDPGRLIGSISSPAER
jgi:purine-binding chemotaxis protein CheW